jgi:DNA-binding transcriptional ArsR family regulator
MSTFPSEPDQQFKAYVYEQFARLGKALSSPARLILLNILCQGERSVEDLAATADLSIANTSRHLQVLKSTNLVTVRRAGTHVFYSVTGDKVRLFFDALRDLALDRLAELRQALSQISDSETRRDTVSKEELVEKASGDDAVILDVRPTVEYQAFHIPGSMSIPIDELNNRLDELVPIRDKELIVVCRGKYCVLADQAIPILRELGLHARRAADGAIEWPTR